MIDPLRMQSPILLARSTPSPQSSVASDVEVLAMANTKTKKPRVKSADWTELRKKRTNFMKRGPPNSISCREFHKEKKRKNQTLERYLLFVLKIEREGSPRSFQP